MSDHAAKEQQAVALIHQGKLQEAGAIYKELITEGTKDHIVYGHLAAIYLMEGRHKESIQLLQKALEINPDYPEGHNDLGIALKAQGDLQAAIASYNTALQLKPNYPQGHNNLGIALKEQGDLQAAIASYNTALQLKPNFPEAHNNLGIALKEQGDLQAAIASYITAFELKSNFPEAHNNLGNALKAQGDLDVAIASYNKALQLKPNYPEAHNNLGNAFKAQGDLTAAIASYNTALQLKPNYPEAHNNLGIALQEQDELDAAIASYNTALQLKPNFPDAHYNLGNALKAQGDLHAAIDEWGIASMQSPETPLYWMKSRLYFKEFYECQEDINEARQKYKEGLDQLVLLEAPNNPRRPQKALETDMFWIAYHNCHDDRALLEKISSSIKSSPFTRGFIRQAESDLPARRMKSMPRIGICSQFLGNHTIGRLYSGIIERMNASNCETILLYPNDTKRDNHRKIISKTCSKVIDLPANYMLACERVLGEQLDVLFYPDIGMSPFTYQMALSRLAPIQMTSWGHPNTTGLSTIDYFVSSSLIESENSQDYYAEQLVLLSRLPCIYDEPVRKESSSSQCNFKELPSDRVLIGIPQSLFKFHPDYDEILESIALEVPSACFVLINGHSNLQTERLKDRWRRRAPTVAKNSVFLPRMNSDIYLEFLDSMDLLLDPFYFGSGNTFYEAMAVGTPLITMPGNYMRGRIVAGGYQQMNLENAPVARSPDEYVEWCKRLAESSDIRDRLKDDIRNAAQQHLFNDQEAGDEFIEFIFAAIESDRAGRKLPLEWQSAINFQA